MNYRKILEFIIIIFRPNGWRLNSEFGTHLQAIASMPGGGQLIEIY